MVFTEIILPENAPIEFENRSVLWNSVEKIEKAANSQLAREIELALPKELTIAKNISLVREYCRKHFVSSGMVADFAIHDNKGNPHAHILLTMRPFNENKSWDIKEKKDYALDENGERIPILDSNGVQKVDGRNRKQWKRIYVQNNDWNNLGNAEIWREAWANMCNDSLEKNNHTDRIDHRSFERQSVEQVPTIHMGVAASQMECKGIITDKGNKNRRVYNLNQQLRQLRERIIKLQKWIREESKSEISPTMYDVIQNILSRKDTQKYRNFNLQSASQALLFLQKNNISDMEGLEQKIKYMLANQREIVGRLKKIDRRLKILDEHIKQSDCYFSHKKIYKEYQTLNPKNQSKFREKYRDEITQYEAAEHYLKSVLNGRYQVPITVWKEEHNQLTSERDTLNREYYSLKNEVNEVDKIRRSVYDLMKVESRNNPNRTNNLEM